MKNFFKPTAAVLLLAACVACSTPAKVNFLKDMEYGKDYPAPPAPELVVQRDDCISILVASDTPELAAPFNLLPKRTEDGKEYLHHYLVDRDGRIDFPVLGSIPVEGLTLKQVKEVIVKRIREGGYIQEPIVEVNLDNFTVTVVGKIGNNVLPVEGNSINLLQVIARSGQITGQSEIREVMVVRTENGVRRSYKVNLQSYELFDSPVFYLKQNDVVYVKQRGSNLSSAGQVTLSIVSSGLTLVNIIMNYILWSSR